MNTQKEWYKSKLIWYAIVSGVAGIITAVQSQYPDIAGLALANSLVVAFLRMLTTTEIK